MKADWGEIRETLRRDPNNAEALRSVGRYYLQDDRFKNAKESYAQAVLASPHLLAPVLLDYEQRISQAAGKSGPRLSLAGFHLLVGETDPALLELEEALEIGPGEIEIYNVLGKIYVNLGRTDEAIDLLERSLKAGIKDVALTEILAAAYLSKGRTKEAIRFYKEILDHRPNDKQVWRTLGELYTREEDYDQAAQCFQAMFSDDPEVGREVTQRLEELLNRLEGNIFVREILADIYTRSLKPDQAIAKLLEISRLDSEKNDEVIVKLKGLLKSYPQHPQAVLALAEALRRQRNLSEAIELYHDLARNKPELTDEAMLGYREILDSFPDQALARTYLAEAFLAKKQIGEALIELENMMRVDPATAELVVKKCREIIRNEPGLLEAHLVLGRAYLLSGDVQRAVMEAENVLSANKKMTAAYLLLGEAYLRQDLAAKAVETLRGALKLEPFDLEVHKQYKEAREKATRQELEALKQKLGEDPWKVSWHFELAKLHLQLAEREAAVRELQFTLKDQTKAAAACNLLGTISRGEGRYDLAAAQFNRGLENAPPELFQTLQANLGSAFEAVGEIRKALKCYERVLQDNIDFADLQKKVKYLKATDLSSLRHKLLLLSTDSVACWGRQRRTGRSERKEELSVSFGQNYNTSGFEYFMKGMYKAAQDEFTLAAQLDSSFAAALNNLAVCLAKEGRLGEAKGRLQEAVQLEPLSAVTRNNLGVVLFLMGQMAPAKEELEKAFEADRELSTVRLNLADLYYAEKYAEKAVALYRQIGQYDVMTEAAERRLRYLVA